MLTDLLLSLCIPGTSLFILGRTQQLFPNQSQPTQLAIAMMAAVAYLGIAAVSLCSTGFLQPLPIGVIFGLILLCWKKPTISLQYHFWPLLLLIPYFAMALLPPWYRDSLTYHLALPRLYALHDGYAATDEVIFSYFPLFWQSFLSLFHRLGEDGFSLFNPRLITVWVSAALAFGTSGLALQLGANQRAAALAAACLLLIPTQIEFGTSCYVQVWLSLLTILTISGMIMNTKRGIYLAGICAGLAASSKYSGLFVPLLGILVLLIYRPQHLKIFLLITVLLGSPFYLQNIYLKGNPVFPLAYGIFGGEGWDTWRSMAYAVTLENYGMGRSLSDYLLLPWRIITTTDLERSFQGSLGPMFGVATLLGIYHCLQTREKKHLYCMLFSTGWIILWALQVQQIRFIMPCVGILLAVGCSVIARFSSIVLLLCLLTSIGWAIQPTVALWQRQHTTEYLSGRLQETAWLHQQLPQSYPIYQSLMTHHPTKVWLVWMRGYHYYLDAPARIDNVFGAWRFEQALETPKTLAAQAIRSNISHILVHHGAFLHDGNADLKPGRTTQLQQNFQSLLTKRILQEVESYPQPIKIPHQATVVKINAKSVVLRWNHNRKQSFIRNIQPNPSLQESQELLSGEVIGYRPLIKLYKVSSSENSLSP